MDRSYKRLKNYHISSNMMIYLGLALVIIGTASYILNSLQLWPFNSEESFEPSDSNYLSSNSTVPTIESENQIFKESPSINNSQQAVGLLPTAQPLMEPNEFPGMKPDRLVIPSINLDVSVENAVNGKLKVESEKFDSWKAPDKNAAGWHESSALLGKPGNTVINGHNSYSLNGIDIIA